jgi:hypothetical protein
MHRVTHARESSVHQQPRRLIDQERHNQDAAQGEPERRLDLSLKHTETEPPEDTHNASDNGRDEEAEPGSERQCGHEEAR